LRGDPLGADPTSAEETSFGGLVCRAKTALFCGSGFSLGSFQMILTISIGLIVVSFGIGFLYFAADDHRF
jgi:hypothetical protein